MKIKAYRLYDHAVAIRPAALPSQWIEQNVSLSWFGASSQSWDLLCPVAFAATWNGGAQATDIEIRFQGESAPQHDFVQSILGEGLLTFYSGYQFKIDGDYALCVRGPIRAPKDALSPLEQMHDLSLLPGTVAIHWQFTRPHQTIRFAAGEPFATLLLYPKASLADSRVEVQPRPDDEERYVQTFQQTLATPVLQDLFQRLGATVAPIEKPNPAPVPQPLPVTVIDTAYGPVDLEQFAPGFFLPERFFINHRLDLLQQYGEVHPCDFYVLDDRKLVYLSIPKAACSSIKLALAKASGIAFGPDQDIEYIHLHPQWHLEKGWLTAAQTGYERFSFVRNPFARLVSCYRQKILFTPTPTIKWPLYQNYFFALPTQIPFADFVTRICQIPDALADNHFKSQYALLYRAGNLRVDYVGKVEQLDRDWQPLAEKYHLDARLVHTNITPSQPGSPGDYRLYYTEPLVHSVYQRYQQDIETFGYVTDYQHLLAFVRQQAQPTAEVQREGVLCS